MSSIGKLLGKGLLVLVLFFSLSNISNGQIYKSPNTGSIRSDNFLDLNTDAAQAYTWTLNGGAPILNHPEYLSLLWFDRTFDIQLSRWIRILIWWFELGPYYDDITVVKIPLPSTSYTRVPDSDRCRGDDYL